MIKTRETLNSWRILRDEEEIVIGIGEMFFVE